MKRLVVIVLAAMAGSTAGYVAKQLNDRRSASEPAPLVIGAPAVNAAIAAIAGLISGRRGRPVAFTVGFAISAIAGLSMQQALRHKVGLATDPQRPDAEDQASETNSNIDSSK